MEPEERPAERRREPRLNADCVALTVRLPRTEIPTPATALDFNRFGLGIRTADPLPKEQHLYLSLRCGGIVVDDLVGVVHNCSRQVDGYRSGIRFRLGAMQSRARERAEHLLGLVEEYLQAPRLSGDTGRPLRAPSARVLRPRGPAGGGPSCPAEESRHR